MRRFSVLLPPFFLSILCGVFAASLDTPPTWFAAFLAVGAVMCFVSLFMSHRKEFALIMFVFLGLLIGIERYALWDSPQRNSVILEKVGSIVLLEGRVSDEPEVREGKMHLTVALYTTDRNGEAKELNEGLRVIVNRFPEYHYGDRLLIEGKLTVPEKFTEDDGRVFDYPKYLQSKGIYYQMIFPSITLTGVGGGSSMLHMLFAIKSHFEHVIASVLPSPHSALLSGLLLGGKQSLGEEWLERFRVAGIIHIVVLSGYNMTIVAEWLVVLFRSFGFYGSLSAGAVGIIVFALMTGGGATVIRAAIMALIVLFARATGRTYDMGRALLLAGTLMVLQNPSILLFDPSFQLSFLASLGLVFISPIIEQKVRLFRGMTMLREVLVSTIATQLTVLPLLLYQTGMLSLVALPANLLVLPFIPFTMLLGFLAAIVGLFSVTLGIFIALPAQGLLSWILAVAKHAEAVPYAAVHTGSISALIVFVLYAVLGFFAYTQYSSKKS